MLENWTLGVLLCSVISLTCYQVKFLQNTSPLIYLQALYFAGYDLGLRSQSLNFASGDEPYKQENLQYLNWKITDEILFWYSSCM